MSERRDIGWRLENWGRWSQERAQGGVSPTHVYCERLRKDAIGELGPSVSNRRRVDEEDARAMEATILTLKVEQRLLLKLCYVDGSPPEYVARKCRFPVRDFVATFRSAQRLVQCAAEIS